MPSSPPAAGCNLKMYRNTASYTTPTWALVAEVEDVSISDLARSIAELKRRASGFSLGLPAIIQLIKVEFKRWHGLDATEWTTFITRFFSGGVEEWAFMDGLIATSGSQGLRLANIISECPWDQALEDAS